MTARTEDSASHHSGVSSAKTVDGGDGEQGEKVLREFLLAFNNGKL